MTDKPTSIVEIIRRAAIIPAEPVRPSSSTRKAGPARAAKPRRTRRADGPPELGQDAASVFGRSDPGSLPVIRLIGGDLPGIVDAAEGALISSKPDLYRYGGQLVRPIVEEVPAADMTKTQVHRLVPVTRAYLVDKLTSVSRWARFDRRSRIWNDVDCPDQIAEIYLAREGGWQMPPLAGIISAPMMRSDGSILEQPGYDRSTGLLYRSDGVTFDSIAASPTRQDAERALLLLDDLISTFPFLSPADHSVALSAILSTLDRRAVSAAPMHTFSAPVAGSGKSMLVDLCSMIATGRKAPVLDQSKDDIETDKRLVAALLRGSALVSIDNVERPLDSALLCQALTSSGMMQLRILGSSRDVDVPNTAMFFATGNNLTLAGDLTRRAVVCRLDPGCERPELRAFNCDPSAMVREDRRTYVAAALTVLRAYFITEDRVTVPPLGSYEQWSGRVREALVWLGRADPCDTMASARRADPVTAELSNVITAWRNGVGLNKNITVQAIVEMTNRRVDLADGSTGKLGAHVYPDLRDALLAVAAEGREINVRRLGKWLSKNEDRVINGCKITRADIQTSQVRWSVQEVGLKV